MTHRFTARVVAAEVDPDNEMMQAGVAADEETAYGCVREVALSDRLLTVSLDPASLDDLGLEDPEIEAELDVPDKDIERMRAVLAQVLAFGRADARPQRVDLQVHVPVIAGGGR